MSKKKKYQPPTLMPDNVSGQLKAIGVEADRLHEDVKWSAQGQFEQMKVWRLMNYVLGIPAATLAAVAGGTGLASDQPNHLMAVLALLAAGFGAALTTLNPSRRVSQSQAAANAYLELQTSLRQFLTIDLEGANPSEARTKLEELTMLRGEVNGISDPPGLFPAWRAKKNIENGRQDNDIDTKKVA